MNTSTADDRLLRPDSRIYVAGHTGMVGNAVTERLRADGHGHLITRTHGQLDLTHSEQTTAFFDEVHPEHVIMCAARVGGILANSTQPAQFIYDNLAISVNVIHEAWRTGAGRLIYLGSSCIYPRNCPQPMREEHLLSGPLEATNRPYAVAKIAGVEMCWAYNRQYGTQFLSVMPTNMFGPHDNYDLETSHVLPALIRRMHEAKVRDDKTVTLWGTGRARREFLYSEDLADAMVFLLNLPEKEWTELTGSETVCPLLNIGYGKDLTIRELAELIMDVVGFEGEIEWDKSKPDGTPLKLMDSSRLHALGWKPKTSLREGIEKAYADFQQRHANDTTA